MRRILFWAHLGAGVLVSALVLFFSITGMLLTYERQIVNAADAHSYKADTAPANARRMPLAALLAGFSAAVSSPVDMITLHNGASLPVEIQTADRSVYFVDPYSGKVQGPESPRLRGFFAEVTALHRWFGLSNASHAAAIAVKGVVMLLFLFLLVSGAVLWLPARFTRNALRSGTVPRFDVGGRVRNYNWHRVTGFWLFLPLLTLVLTGVVMAYPWANALLFRIAGSPVPVRRPQPPRDSGKDMGARHHGPKAQVFPAHLDEAFILATSGVNGWQSAGLRLQGGRPELSIAVDRSEGGHPEQRVQLSIDAEALQVLHREPFSAMSRGQQWRSWVRFTHTGEAGGWWGETLALLTAFGATVLSVTGVALSYDRLRRWRS